MLQELKQLSASVKFANPYWTYKFDLYTRPNGTTGEYHYVHTPGSVMIVPRLADGRFAMIRQYRYLNSRESLEFPGGGIPHGVEIQTQAFKELEEETGWRASSMSIIGQFNPMNGITDELCTVFAATELFQPSTNLTHDDSEEFERVAISFEEINEYIRSGILWDGMTLAAWQLFTLNVHSEREHFFD